MRIHIVVKCYALKFWFWEFICIETKLVFLLRLSLGYNYQHVVRYINSVDKTMAGIGTLLICKHIHYIENKQTNTLCLIHGWL